MILDVESWLWKALKLYSQNFNHQACNPFATVEVAVFDEDAASNKLLILSGEILLTVGSPPSGKSRSQTQKSLEIWKI